MPTPVSPSSSTLMSLGAIFSISRCSARIAGSRTTSPSASPPGPVASLGSAPALVIDAVSGAFATINQLEPISRTWPGGSTVSWFGRSLSPPIRVPLALPKSSTRSTSPR